MNVNLFAAITVNSFLPTGERNQKYLELKKREETMQGMTSSSTFSEAQNKHVQKSDFLSP